MLKYKFIRDNNIKSDTIIIQITEEGKYKDAIVGIDNIGFDNDNILRYEMSLDKKCSDLFNDDTFKDEIGIIVGEMVKQTVSEMQKTQDQMIRIETKVGELLKEKNITRDEKKLLIEIFSEKGYLLTEKDGKIIAVKIDVQNPKEYDLWNEEDFNIVKKDVFPSKLIV